MNLQNKVLENKPERKHRMTMTAELTDAEFAAVKFMARLWNETPEELLAAIGIKGIYWWLDVVEEDDEEREKLKDALSAERHS